MMLVKEESSYYFLYLNILAYIYLVCTQNMLHTVNDTNK